MKYSSSLSRSREPKAEWIELAWSRTVSRMLCPSRRRWAWAWTSSGRPSMNSRAKTARGRRVGRNQRAAARPGQAEAFFRKRQAAEAGLVADVLGRDLIERNRIAESAANFRMRSRGEKAVDRIVAGADLRMREAGDHAEVVAEILDHVEIGRRFVILARLWSERKIPDASPAACRCNSIRRIGASCVAPNARG